MNIIEMLEKHGVLYYVTDSRKVMALDAETYVNVTNWTCKQLIKWLGY